jgi:predicted metalloprotease
VAANRRRKRTVSTTIAVLVCVALIGGCSRAISGTPTTPGSYSTTEVAGLPATDGPSGPKAAASESPLPVENTDHGEMDKLARDAVSDIEGYWRQVFPQSFNGKQFTDVKRLVSYDSAGPGVALCNSSTAGLVNAFYCPTDDAIAWDRGQLLPKLKSSFGPMAVVAVLAHEMGHAVQQRAGTAGPNAPVIVSEQQADCFAGTFFRHVAEGSSPHFQISTGDGLNRVMGVLNYIRDTPGGSSFTGSNAHGSAFDRVTAFQYGFSDGPKRCAKMDAKDVKHRTTQFEFWKNAQETDLPVTTQNINSVEESLKAVFRDTGATPPTITTEPQACQSARITSPAAYCPDSNTVSLNMQQLQKIATPPQKDKQDAGYGDFAAYAQVASRYALSVQKAAGMSLDDENAALRTACLVGAWSGLLVEDPIGQRNPVGKLRIAPGDVDEGVAALLGDDSLIAANVNGDKVRAGFARVDAFRAGFQEGLAPCSSKYGS